MTKIRALASVDPNKAPCQWSVSELQALVAALTHAVDDMRADKGPGPASPPPWNPPDVEGLKRVGATWPEPKGEIPCAVCESLPCRCQISDPAPPVPESQKRCTCRAGAERFKAGGGHETYCPLSITFADLARVPEVSPKAVEPVAETEAAANAHALDYWYDAAQRLQRDHDRVKSERDQALRELAEAKKDVQSLRFCLCNIVNGLGNGSGVAPSISTGFLLQADGETLGVIRDLRAKVSELEAKNVELLCERLKRRDACVAHLKDIDGLRTSLVEAERDRAANRAALIGADWQEQDSESTASCIVTMGLEISHGKKQLAAKDAEIAELKRLNGLAAIEILAARTPPEKCPPVWPCDANGMLTDGSGPWVPEQGQPVRIVALWNGTLHPEELPIGCVTDAEMPHVAFCDSRFIEIKAEHMNFVARRVVPAEMPVKP